MATYWGSTTGSKRFEKDELLEHAINENHSYTPTFKYYKKEGDDAHFFGIEFEFEYNGSPDSTMEDIRSAKETSARNVLMYFNAHNRQVYIKRDGSLRHGFELVTMPMTLNYLEGFNADEISSLFDEQHLVANDRCGLHVHLSYSMVQNSSLFIKNMYSLLPFMLYISKRKNYRSLRQYSAIGSFDKDSITDYISDYVKFVAKTGTIPNRPIYKNRSSLPFEFEPNGRYSYIRPTDDTIEVRLFKGTTDFKLAMTYIKMLSAVASLTRRGVEINSVYDVIVEANDADFTKKLTDLMNDMIKDVQFMYKAQKVDKLIYKSLSTDDETSDIITTIPFKYAGLGDCLIPKSSRDFIINRKELNNPGFAMSRLAYEIVKINDTHIVAYKLDSRETFSLPKNKINDFIFIKRYIRPFINTESSGKTTLFPNRPYYKNRMAY